MKSFALLLSFVLLVAAALTLACGSPASHLSPSCSSVPSQTNNGIPQSVTLCPAAADAKDFPDGEIQFVAIGSYSSGPSPALPNPVLWGSCQNQAPTTGIVVSTTGLAHCASGASGKYTVWATAGPIMCLVISPCGACAPTAQAQLTCP
jgi:hypothetical protein